MIPQGSVCAVTTDAEIEAGLPAREIACVPRANGASWSWGDPPKPCTITTPIAGESCTTIDGEKGVVR